MKGSDMSEKNSDVIYHRLREQILLRPCSPDAFLVERDIAAEFGVSRTPVRDALQRLCQEGYIVAYPRKGYMVRRVDNDYILQIQQIRFQLESLSLALVIKNATDQELAQVALSHADSRLTDPYHTDNTLFHTRLAQLSRNDQLAKSIYQYLGDCSLGVFQHPQLIQDWNNFHREILQAVKDRDFSQAQEYLARDLQLSSCTRGTFLLPL